MQLKTTNKQFVDEVPYGVYVWFMPDGRVVKDEEGNFLNIPAMRGDKERIGLLVKEARNLGLHEGRPVFVSGQRRVTDEEYEEQLQRMKFGLTPDPWDVPTVVEEKNARQRGN